MEFGAAMFFTDYAMEAGAFALALEERGFDSVWAPEHSHIPASRLSPFPQGTELPRKYAECMDPFVSLSVAAAVTKTIKLGTGVCLVVQRDPASLPVTLFGVPPDLDRSRYYRDAGVARVVVSLNSAGAEDVLSRLDRWAELRHRLGV